MSDYSRWKDTIDKHDKEDGICPLLDDVYEQGKADAIDEFVDSVVIKIGLLKQSANDEWVDYVLNDIKKFVISKAEQLKENKNDD